MVLIRAPTGNLAAVTRANQALAVAAVALGVTTIVYSVYSGEVKEEAKSKSAAGSRAGSEKGLPLDSARVMELQHQLVDKKNADIAELEAQLLEIQTQKAGPSGQSSDAHTGGKGGLEAPVAAWDQQGEEMTDDGGVQSGAGAFSPSMSALHDFAGNVRTQGAPYTVTGARMGIGQQGAGLPTSQVAKAPLTGPPPKAAWEPIWAQPDQQPMVPQQTVCGGHQAYLQQKQVQQKPISGTAAPPAPVGWVTHTYPAGAKPPPPGLGWPQVLVRRQHCRLGLP